MEKYRILMLRLLHNAYQIAKKWNISDHHKRVKDGSCCHDEIIDKRNSGDR